MPDATAAPPPAPPPSPRATRALAGRARRRGPGPALGALFAAALLCAGPSAGGADAAHGTGAGASEGAAGTQGSEFIGATWYADGSCSLSVGGRPSVGRTAIDAGFDEIGARTLVHCDTEDERRVTILSRGGEALALGERTDLLAPHEIDGGLDGSIAWVARSGEGFADDSVPRRFVLRGKVLIRHTPATFVAGSAPRSDVQPFAELTGQVEPVARAPSDDDLGAAVPPAGADAADPPEANPAEGDGPPAEPPAVVKR